MGIWGGTITGWKSDDGVRVPGEPEVRPAVGTSLDTMVGSTFVVGDEAVGTKDATTAGESGDKP